MSASIRRRAAVALVALAASGCGLRLPEFKPFEGLDRVETRVYLVGDAGAATAKDPVLSALANDVARDPVRSIVVFLGDNLYPAGLSPDPEAPGRSSGEKILDAQVDVVRKSNARAIFIPGNHDWGGIDGGPDGLARIRAQEAWVTEKGGPGVTYAPGNGCPGPYVRDVDTRLRLILLDSHWWMHPYEKPREGDGKSDCPTDREAEILATLESAIRTAGDRAVIVAAHHPLASGGEHGGYFSWSDHLFPLRAKRSWLWIPLPVIGSAYPIARIRGVSNQDMSGPLNRRYREALEGVFQNAPPLVFAAGHEHNLQVLAGKDVRWLLVSGAGYFAHTTRVVVSAPTRFAREASGFMRIDVGTEATRLAVFTVDGRGAAHEAWSTRLDEKKKEPKS